MDAATLSQTAELMILRRDELVEIAGVPPDPTFPVEQVGYWHAFPFLILPGKRRFLSWSSLVQMNG